MRRTSYIPHNDEKPEPRYGKGEYERPEAEEEENEADWEFQSIENFCEDKLGNDESEYTAEELQRLARAVRIRYQQVQADLAAYGLTLKERVAERNFRTFGDNPNNRFTTPEARRMSGGSGGNQIMRMAGR